MRNIKKLKKEEYQEYTKERLLKYRQNLFNGVYIMSRNPDLMDLHFSDFMEKWQKLESLDKFIESTYGIVFE